uniref:Uncharacterized protein n=1 Tax=Rhizophora mucronata TaxID=61149 RepID=A0A2P2IHK9_RHIMU
MNIEPNSWNILTCITSHLYHVVVRRTRVSTFYTNLDHQKWIQLVYITFPLSGVGRMSHLTSLFIIKGDQIS